MLRLDHGRSIGWPLPGWAPLRTSDIALALALSVLVPASARGDEIFASVGNFGSGGYGPNAVVQQAAQGVADRLNAQSPSFVLGLGDMLYGPYPTNTFLEFQPLGPSGDPSFETFVGDLYGQYIKQSALVPNGGSTMNFFPVLGDHDWHHETIQIDEETGMSIGPAVLGYDTTVNITTDPTFYTNAQTVYAGAQSYLSGANTNHANTQFGLTTVYDKVTIFGAPDTPENGDTYETYFSGLYGLTTSQTASTAPVRWYDTLQGDVHIFALSTDTNELFQGGLKSIDIQDSGTSADNLANSSQGQWFTAALNASTATWNIVETHQPIASASTPQEGYYTSGVTPQGHMSTAYMQWFDDTKVDLVISAHIHGFERLYNNGVTYINNGAGGSWQQFHYFCEQPGATNSCENTYEVDPNFGGAAGTTWSNNDMIALTQMQVGNTFGFQLFMASDTNNYLESQFWGSTDPGNANGDGANWTLLDDFFILKNGMISASQAQTATGLELKAPNGVSSGFGIIDTSGASGPITLAALINGPGQLVVDGGGTLILERPNVATSAPSVYSGKNYSFMPSGARNTYSGGTYVTGGSTLQIAKDSLLGAASGALTLDAGTLKASKAFSSSRAIVLGSGNGAINTNGNQVTLSGEIAGSGALTKLGADRLILAGSSSYTGPTAVNQGTLAVNGSIVSDVSVNSGGMLGGTGRVGALTVASGGGVGPGNSIGTMTVNGNFTLAAGAVYAVEANAAGQSDKVIVKGTVNLTGSVLRVLAANGNYSTETKYTIVDNDGTDPVTGTFASISSSLAFLVPTVFYNGGTGNDVVPTLERNGTFFSDVAQTRNQRAVAGALDQFPTGNALFLSILNQTTDGARQAFDALSGEIHATVTGMLADDSRYVREAVLGRLMQAGHAGEALSAGGPQVASLDSQAMALGSPLAGDGKSLVAPEREPLAFWTRAYGAWGDFNGDGNAATADRDLGGFVSGMDANIGGSWRVGLATGASFSSVDVDARYSSADVESYTLGGYLGGMAGAFALRGGGMWAWNDIETSRAVVFPGFFERQKASYNADTGQLFGEVAYPTQMGGMAFEPFGGLAYVSIDTDTLKEHGGSLASLRGDADQDVGYATLGVRAATTMRWGTMQLVPNLSVAWQHAFDALTPDATLAFASTGIGFTVYGVPLAQDTALIDAGMDFAVGPSTTAGVSYTAQFGDGVSDNGVKGRFTWIL